MCNLSELVEERGVKKGLTQGITRGIEQERMAAIGRMMKVNVTKEQILSFGYTEDEIEKVKNTLYERV